MSSITDINLAPSGERKIQWVEKNMPILRAIGEEFEKTKAMLRLMCELSQGRRSGEEEGYVSAEDVRTYFQGKRS